MVVCLSKSILLMSEAEESMCKKGYKKGKYRNVDRCHKNNVFKRTCSSLCITMS